MVFIVLEKNRFGSSANRVNFLFSWFGHGAILGPLPRCGLRGPSLGMLQLLRHDLDAGGIEINAWCGPDVVNPRLLAFRRQFVDGNMGAVALLALAARAVALVRCARPLGLVGKARHGHLLVAGEEADNVATLVAVVAVV